MFYLTFAPLHTPLHLTPRLSDLEELFLEFWTGFDPKKEARPFVLQGFFKGSSRVSIFLFIPQTCIDFLPILFTVLAVVYNMKKA